jgi:hypothetical protein
MGHADVEYLYRCIVYGTGLNDHWGMGHVDVEYLYRCIMNGDRLELSLVYHRFSASTNAFKTTV